MKQTIVLKLEPNAEQHAALLATVEAFNRACQYVSDVAYERRLANKIALQKIVYADLRERFGLSSQMAIRAISKVVEAYKRDRRKRCSFDPHGAMVYDERIMSFKGLTHVSLLTLSGRELIPMRYGSYQAERIGRAKGQADLILRDGVFYLYVCIDLPTPTPLDPEGVLGVDLGIANIAVDSEGETFSGEAVRERRRRFHARRKGLQQCGTKSAKRRLKKIKRKESRYQRWVNHNVSKKIVQKAHDGQKALALEDLSGIRERVTVSKSQRYERHSWAFFQLRQFIGYKAEAKGIPVYLIDPAYTSRTCLCCGHNAKENRRSQSKFLCVQCGFQAHADFVGASNIARKGEEARAALTRPMVFPPSEGETKPHTL